MIVQVNKNSKSAHQVLHIFHGVEIANRAKKQTSYFRPIVTSLS